VASVCTVSISYQNIIETSEYPNSSIRSEYVNVYFTLDSDRLFTGDFYLSDDAEEMDRRNTAGVYVIGDFTDWQCKQEFRLGYNSKNKVYTGSALLKQGYYDYQYAVKHEDGSLDIEHFEGSHFAAVNQYNILVYQRSSRERYDELISVSSFESLLGF